MRIAIGSDHGGFELKSDLIRYISGLGHEVKDVGCYSRDTYDFPVSAWDVARAVSTRAADRGIVIDGAGSPSAIVANKIPGIRASVVHDDFTAKISREHSDANVLALGAKVVDADRARSLVELWLRTDFLGGRYQKRIDMITDAERKASGREPRRRVVSADDVKRDPALAAGIDVTLTPLARDLIKVRSSKP
jgi:RpiB/LacA/LacB family sugar-phosphate isomerase